jgi:hypothetical protein
VDVADFDNVTCPQHTVSVRMAIPIAGDTLALGSIVRMRSSRAIAGWSFPFLIAVSSLVRRRPGHISRGYAARLAKDKPRAMTPAVAKDQAGGAGMFL